MYTERSQCYQLEEYSNRKGQSYCINLVFMVRPDEYFSYSFNKIVEKLLYVIYSYSIILFFLFLLLNLIVKSECVIGNEKNLETEDKDTRH